MNANETTTKQEDRWEVVIFWPEDGGYGAATKCKDETAAIEIANTRARVGYGENPKRKGPPTEIHIRHIVSTVTTKRFA
jgi:hypothetical protein